MSHAGGAAVGDEVLLLFHSAGDAIRSAAKHPVPIRQLVGFERVTVAAGAPPATITFAVGPNQLGLVDQDGNTQLVAGQHTATVTNGADFSSAFPIDVAHSRTLRTVPPCPTCPKL